MGYAFRFTSPYTYHLSFEACSEMIEVEQRSDNIVTSLLVLRFEEGINVRACVTAQSYISALPC